MIWSRTNVGTLDIEPGVAWNLLADMARWNRWDPDVASIALHGPLDEGIGGNLVPTGRLRSAVHTRGARSFTVGVYQPGSSIRMDQPIPMGVMRVSLSVTPIHDGRTELTQEVTLTGPFARVMVGVIAGDVVNHFPKKCVALQRLAAANGD